MKFTKFLKSLGGDGVIQEYGGSTFPVADYVGQV